MAQTYIKSLLNGKSTPGRLKGYIRSSLWRIRPIWSHSWMTEVLFIVAQHIISGPHLDDSDLYGVTPEWWKRSWWLLKSLYHILTLAAQTYTELLLNDRSTSDGRSTLYIQSSPWRLRPIKSQSWMMKALLVVTLTAYIESSPRGHRPIRGQSWKIEALLTVTVTAYIGSSS